MRRRQRLASKKLPPDLDTIYDLFEEAYGTSFRDGYEHDLAVEVVDELLSGVPNPDIDWWMKLLSNMGDWELSNVLPTEDLKAGLGHVLLQMLSSNRSLQEEPNPREDYPGQHQSRASRFAAESEMTLGEYFRKQFGVSMEEVGGNFFIPEGYDELESLPLDDYDYHEELINATKQYIDHLDTIYSRIIEGVHKDEYYPILKNLVHMFGVSHFG